ncbi:SDR family NAD(P)-dependent oxidoreductase [Bacillus sp. Marseille-P3661]|uniref:SDR family NAD(P)-dependent oxidoreductase n=1 Tax=Bacillus sp. Marseille-P3661 TaxID=1936234 RepID=UPI000C8459AE|nr:glucose 1-dehydrogenase [Bacillus sp. Marseille-P3661]
MRLKDRVAIITGGGKGIGKVYAERFAQEGAKVVVADIDFGAAEDTVEQIKNNGGNAIAVFVDVSENNSTLEMAHKAYDTFGSIDILINNASLMSVLPRRPWIEIPIEEWDKVMEVNVKGLFLCSKAVYPYMKNNKYGKIVNISSTRVWDGTPNRLHYTSSKAAVIGFTRALAREVGEDYICVNAITPGLTASETQLKETDPKYFENHPSNLLKSIKRMQVPEDLVGAVLFLSSPDSNFITGQTINIDGGTNMH